MNLIERQLQTCLHKRQTWADTNGFRFSKSKTVCIHFCNKCRQHLESHLKLDGTPIPVVKETKFLRIIFDSKLSFIPHLKYLNDKWLKAMNLLRVISSTDWGANSATLLKLYQSLVRSKIRLWLHSLWLCQEILPEYTGQSTKQHTAHLSRCVQDVTYCKPTRRSWRNATQCASIEAYSSICS
jgi:hypothetical protein